MHIQSDIRRYRHGAGAGTSLSDKTAGSIISVLPVSISKTDFRISHPKCRISRPIPQKIIESRYNDQGEFLLHISYVERKLKDL